MSFAVATACIFHFLSQQAVPVHRQPAGQRVCLGAFAAFECLVMAKVVVRLMLFEGWCSRGLVVTERLAVQVSFMVSSFRFLPGRCTTWLQRLTSSGTPSACSA